MLEVLTFLIVLNDSSVEDATIRPSGCGTAGLLLNFMTAAVNVKHLSAHGRADRRVVR